MNDVDFIKVAISKSHESSDLDCFPAGSIIVKTGKVVASEISSPYPDYRHADTKVIEGAFKVLNQRLTSCVQYSSMEPCLMCICSAYWAGIRKIVFSIARSEVKDNYYETSFTNKEITSRLQEPFELMQIVDFKDEAIKIVKDWEKKHGY